MGPFWAFFGPKIRLSALFGRKLKIEQFLGKSEGTFRGPKNSKKSVFEKKK